MAYVRLRGRTVRVAVLGEVRQRRSALAKRKKAARKLLAPKLDELRLHIKTLKQNLRRKEKALDEARGTARAPPPPPAPEQPLLEFLDEDGFYSARTKDTVLALMIEARVPEHRTVQVITIVAKLMFGASIGELPNARRLGESALSEAAEAEELRLAAWLARRCGWDAQISADRPVVTPPTRANILTHGRALRSLTPVQRQLEVDDVQRRLSFLFSSSPPPPPPPPPPPDEEHAAGTAAAETAATETAAAETAATETAAAETAATETAAAETATPETAATKTAAAETAAPETAAVETAAVETAAIHEPPAAPFAVPAWTWVARTFGWSSRLDAAMSDAPAHAHDALPRGAQTIAMPTVTAASEHACNWSLEALEDAADAAVSESDKQSNNGCAFLGISTDASSGYNTVSTLSIDHRSQEGGFVGEGEHRRRIGAGILVKKTELGDALNDRKQEWTNAAIVAQLHMRGLRGLSSKRRDELVALLEQVLDEEDAAEFQARVRTRRTALPRGEAGTSHPGK